MYTFYMQYMYSIPGDELQRIVKGHIDEEF